MIHLDWNLLGLPKVAKKLSEDSQIRGFCEELQLLDAAYPQA